MRMLVRNYSILRSILILCALIVALSACVGQQKRDEREDRLRAFEAHLRFADNFGSLLNFIHPDYLEEHPISSAELNRLNLFRVSGYRTRSVSIADDEKSLTQVVELRLYSKSTQRERTVIYPQLWQQDPNSGVWMLHSGLPEIDNN